MSAQIIELYPRDKDIEPIERIIWPNKVDKIRRRIKNLVRSKETWLDTVPNTSDWRVQDQESRIGGLLEALYIIEQEAE